jgi:hypothetical protein
MRKIAFISVGAILILLGLLAISGTDEGAWLLILPAIPLAMLTNWLDPSARQGLLWDSAHSPPFLNAVGLALVYFLPGLLLVATGVFRRSVLPRGV